MRGPTPPITGVMAERSVRSLTPFATSPFKTPFSEAVPASTTTVPGPTMEFLMRSGTPVAVIIMS